ncbi:MAG TPA: class I poly(R)-hydroxyalkanoic acid synthase, partial [Halomonas sp.]|nr:class I poly(R)-hydroxyalkanoic acid synthase [Halomonas sp.]
MQQKLEAPTQAELEAWGTQLQQIGEEYRALMSDALERMMPQGLSGAINEDMRDKMRLGAEALMSDPALLWQAQTRLLQDQAQLWQHGMRALAGETVEPLVTPQRGDRRFKDEAWTSEPAYASLMQQYLLFSRLVNELVEGLEGLDPDQQRNLEFYLRQLVNAMAPTNFLATNPEAMRQLIETRGQSLADGLAHLRRDLENSAAGGLNVTMTDRSAFEVG